MSTERNAQVIGALRLLLDHVARLDAAGVPVRYTSTAVGAEIHLDLRYFRAYFAGCEVVVKRGASDDYRAERDGVTYCATDWTPNRAQAVTETVRLPGGDVVGVE